MLVNMNIYTHKCEHSFFGYDNLSHKYLQQINVNKFCDEDTSTTTGFCSTSPGSPQVGLPIDRGE